MSLIGRRATKNKYPQLYFFFLLEHFYCFCWFFFYLFFYLLCASSVQCQIPIPPRGLSNVNTKMISAEITSHSLTFFKKNKQYKSQDGIKGKNSISQQAVLLSEHSRVCGKKAWDIKNNNKKKNLPKKKNQRLPTALEQTRSSCTSSIHGLEFLADTFNKDIFYVFLTFQHLLSTCLLCWKATRCAPSEI